MNKMPSMEKIDATLSVTAIALIWPGVAFTAIIVSLVVSIGALPSVST